MVARGITATLKIRLGRIAFLANICFCGCCYCVRVRLASQKAILKNRWTRFLPQGREDLDLARHTRGSREFKERELEARWKAMEKSEEVCTRKRDQAALLCRPPLEQQAQQQPRLEPRAQWTESNKRMINLSNLVFFLFSLGCVMDT
jgi:hypothetical protein